MAKFTWVFYHILDNGKPLAYLQVQLEQNNTNVIHMLGSYIV